MIYRRGNLVLHAGTMSVEAGSLECYGEVHTDGLNWDEVDTYVRWLKDQYPNGECWGRALNEPIDTVRIQIDYDPGCQIDIELTFRSSFGRFGHTSNWMDEFAKAMGFEGKA
jgi:hypothetical protein